MRRDSPAASAPWHSFARSRVWHNNSTMPSTAIYSRISEDRQDGAGVDRQLKDCRTLVKAHGWGPAREFIDNNVSAFQKKPRPQYSAMLAAVKAGEVKRIVVYNLDRL